MMYKVINALYNVASQVIEHQHDLWPISHLRVAKETAPVRGKLGPKVQGGMPHIGTTLI